MSFYGNIKRVNSSPFVFDKYYPNRATMEAEMASDGVYIGRYVLIKYTCAYTSSEDHTLIYFNKYNRTENSIEFTTDYQNNINADKKYKDTFDSTVWQKIYSQGQEKYIMVAELRAEVPKIALETISPKYLTTTSEEGEEWNVPSISAQSDDVFILTMPNSLELDIGNLNTDFYAADLTDPAYRYQMKTEGSSTKNQESTGSIINHNDMFSSEYNKIDWKKYYYNDKKQKINSTFENDPIDGKTFDMKLYSFGQAISDIYDILYGTPSGGTGPRPFYTEEALANIGHKYDKGLVGILSSIATEAKGNPDQDTYGRIYQPGQYYYFCSKWNSAEEDSNNFIENIPEIVGAKNNGSKLKSHYFIDFDATDGNYLSNNWSQINN